MRCVVFGFKSIYQMKNIKTILITIAIGFVGAVAFSLPFVWGVQNDAGIISFLFLSWAHLVEWISFPITSLFCCGLCVGDEAMYGMLSAPITGFILGAVLGWWITKKYLTNTSQ